MQIKLTFESMSKLFTKKEKNINKFYKLCMFVQIDLIYIMCILYLFGLLSPIPYKKEKKSNLRLFYTEFSKVDTMFEILVYPIYKLEVF